MRYLRAEPEVRFWRFVDKSDECWLWNATKNKEGYGSFWNGKKLNRAHRWIWEHHYKKPIPKGMYICHNCDNPSCVKPSHLFLGTPKENAQDRCQKGRSNTATGLRNGAYTMPHTRARGDRNGMRIHPESVLRGSRNGSSKLDEYKVKEIRKRHKNGETQQSLAKEFCVNQPNISRIIRCVIWKHVK